MNTINHRQRGLTMVELLVAIAIGALLLGGAATLFVNNRATYNLTNDMARMQENARFALDTMVGDLRMAGYVGCVNDPSKINNNTGATAGQLWDPTNLIEGIDDGGATWLPSGHVGATLDDARLDVTAFHGGSDAITIRYLSGDRTDTDADGTPDRGLTNSVFDGATTIAVEALDAAAFVQDTPGGLADCGASDVFVITNDPSVTGNVTANALSRAYDPINEALLAPMVGVRYFVLPDTPIAGVQTLFRAVITPGPAESVVPLIEGVESLQILYGADTDGDGAPNGFVNATAVTNWNNVVAVRVALLLATVDDIGFDAMANQRFLVAGTKFCSPDVTDADCDVALPNDRRRRRAFDTTVAVRNLQ